MADDFAAKLLAVQKKYKTGVGPLSKIAQPSMWISTGNLAIDYICGGGFPLGRQVELAGPPSSGKTTTALQCAAVLQKIILGGGGVVVGSDGTHFQILETDKILFMDYEQTIDQDYAAALGLDIDDDSFLLAQPDTLEDGANLAVELIETGSIRLVIWDSVAAMMPSAKADAEIGKSLPAVQAKLMSDLGQKLNPILYQHKTLNIWVNHLKEVMTMGRPAHLGPVRTTPGGVALKFYATIRLEYKQVGHVKDKILDTLSGEMVETPGATKVEVKVTKNKVAPPFKKATIQVRFGQGFDNYWTAVQTLIAAKEIMYSTGYYYFHKVADKGLAPEEWMQRATTGIKRPYIKTDPAMRLAAQEHPEWADALVQHAVEWLKGNDVRAISAADSVEELEEDARIDEEIAEILPKSDDGNRVDL